MAWQNNSAELCGMVDAPGVFSHRSRGVDYYSFPLLTRRLSGAEDLLNVTLPGPMLPQLPPAGWRLSLRGEVRSFNNRSGEGSRLLLYVYAQELLPPEEEDRNTAELAGTLCREPSWRRTPMGREICDLMLAVNRRYGRSDYLPCIAWGAAAREAALWDVGDSLRLNGRIQSRRYSKTVDGETLEKTAYEVSVIGIRRELPE